MNAIDNEKVRALLLYRTRRALAGNEAMRWERIASAILSVAASARLLRDVADFAQACHNVHAIEGGRAIERAIVHAIADAIGVDVLAAITQEAEPFVVKAGELAEPFVVHACGPVYVLPTGWTAKPLDPRPAFYHLN